MKPQNLLVIMSDEHNPKYLGCKNHPLVKTPNLDKLAADGARFDSAYTPSPICVPARASFATGKYVHQINYWDNALAFDGSVPSWHSVLRERGHQVVSIGKLHFRSSEDDNGFSDEQIAMHVIDGKGDLMGLVRGEDMPVRKGAYKMARMAGPGESVYTTYDRDITARAQSWLSEEASKYTDKPWILFVSLVCPHFPLTAPTEHFNYYYNQDIPLPKLYEQAREKQHPYIQKYRATMPYNDFFKTPDMVKRALAGYLGLCSFVDENVGKILNTLEDSGLVDNTRIIYTSDHGDNNGARGIWGKSTMYEESVGVPLILKGPDIPSGVTETTPVNLTDLYPFIIDAVGELDDESVTAEHPGINVLDVLAGNHPNLAVFSEYHAMCSKSASFMIRKGIYKLVYYIDYEPQLFDIAADPEELKNLAGLPEFTDIQKDLTDELFKICDPHEVDRKAKADQVAMLAACGGKEAVIARGDLGFSVPPGVEPMFD
ncbi:sulfatase-like hydrolase/transferase [Sneathiella sp.]|uniref:sulfatase-like hydrolase/transferase n=1 Tax=Sneathiella sp. TaxID=1964365 RepID=UPI003562E1C6